jgi:hypothetical protein
VGSYPLDCILALPTSGQDDPRNVSSPLDQIFLGTAHSEGLPDIVRGRVVHQRSKPDSAPMHRGVVDLLDANLRQLLPCYQIDHLPIYIDLGSLEGGSGEASSSDGEEDEEEMKRSAAAQLLLAQGQAAALLTLVQEGFRALDTPGDGNCLFHAVRRQLSGPQLRAALGLNNDAFGVLGEDERVARLRAATVGRVRADNAAAHHFADDEERDAHCDEMEEDGTHGTVAEIEALSHLLNRRIRLYSPQHQNGADFDFRPRAHQDLTEPIRIYWNGADHYEQVG